MQLELLLQPDVTPDFSFKQLDLILIVGRLDIANLALGLKTFPVLTRLTIHMLSFGFLECLDRCVHVVK